MNNIARTFVRLTATNRLRIDRMRRHHALSRDRIVNDIVADYFDQIYEELRREQIQKLRENAA